MKLSPVAMLGLAGLALGASPAFATGEFDTTAVVATIAAMGVSVGLIGAAKLSPATIAVGFKWLKAAIFG